MLRKKEEIAILRSELAQLQALIAVFDETQETRLLARHDKTVTRARYVARHGKSALDEFAVLKNSKIPELENQLKSF